MGRDEGFPAAPAVSAPPTLVCAWGEVWIGPHPLCEAETDRACALFDVAVAAGTYCRHGYTPREATRSHHVCLCIDARPRAGCADSSLDTRTSSLNVIEVEDVA